MNKWAKNAAAFVSAAKTCRRLSWLYRNMATENRAKGFGYEADRLEAEANRLKRSATGHLVIARANYELSQRMH